eukprot:PhF_6_TR39807/c0_g1_i1/m.59196/K15289/SLC35F5; solute carrier family 35, member F5
MSQIKGSLLIMCVVLMWVSASEVTQHIMTQTSFNKPLCLTYLSACGFSLWLPVWWIMYGQSWRSFWCACRQLKMAVVCITPTWYLANVVYNASLGLTSVASNSVLSNTSSLWTLCLSCCVLGHALKLPNVISVLCTLLGALCVGLGDGSIANQELSMQMRILGDGFAIAAAFVFSIETLLFKYFLTPLQGEEHADCVMLTLGLVGVYGAVTLWPVLVVANGMGYEEFQLPSTHVFGLFLLKLLFGCILPHFLLAKGILFAGPLVATLGLSLTIPVAMVWDYALHSENFTKLYVVGSIMVVSGFILGNVYGEQEGAHGCPNSANKQECHQHLFEKQNSTTVCHGIGDEVVNVPIVEATKCKPLGMHRSSSEGLLDKLGGGKLALAFSSHPQTATANYGSFSPVCHPNDIQESFTPITL